MTLVRAADSAVTIMNSSGAKVYNTVNKLFALSYRAPVGIMIYGGADICGVPWEVIIKEFRASLGSNKLERLDDYCERFCQFIDGGHFFSDEVQKTHVRNSAVLFLANMLYVPIETAIHAVFEAAGEITRSQTISIITREIRALRATMNELPFGEGFSHQDLAAVTQTYSDEVSQAVDAVFEDLPLGARNIKQIHDIYALFATKQFFTPSMSGIVVAGYGEREYFPSVISYEYDGVVLGKPKWRTGDRVAAGPEMRGAVVPFAQREMVNLFMEGVDPAYRDTVQGALASFVEGLPDAIADGAGITGDARRALARRISVSANQLLGQFRGELEKYSYQAHIEPIIDAVSALPKDELGAMAESLVSLTSFKRRVTLDAETVGGAIDVAVISKGDGLIWLKRKHYFDPASNPQYFARFQ